MEKLVAYKRMPLWNKQTMPEAVQQKHNTKVGTWGKITVLKGALKFIELTEEGEVLAEHLFEAGADNPMAQPQAWHEWKLPQMMWNGTWNFIVNLRIILLKNTIPILFIQRS